MLAAAVLALSPADALLEKAESFHGRGKLEKAMTAAGDAAVKAQEASDTCALIKAYCLQAEFALESGNDLEAVDLYNRCIELTPYGKPMFLLSSSLYDIASIYYQNGENEKALEYITKSILIDSRRESDSLLALRYLLASEILYNQGEYSKAIEMAQTGRTHTRPRKNYNVEGRLMLVQVKCREAMAGANPDWASLESGYRQALETLNTTFPKYHRGINPYEPEFLYHLGLAVAAQGRDASDIFAEAIRISRTPQNMHGDNPLIELECCRALADILLKKGDEAGAEQYLERAEELSFVPYLREMSTKMSLSQMEFIRREKEMEIEHQKEKELYLWIMTAVFAFAAVCMSLMYRQQLRQKRKIEEKNAQLVKLDLQKSRLIDMLQEMPVHESIGPELKGIADDSIPLPDINLSKRELEVLQLCCKGMISKEIAAQLHLSVRTVESHKGSLFRKLGVNTTNELIAFAFKSGCFK